MTNYERIKSMSIDEMAGYLIDCCNCPNDMFLCGSKGSVGEKHIKYWLESEVENRMTEKDIVKALENEIRSTEYVDSSYCDGIDLSLIKSALNLITQQQAEIDRLKAEENKYPFKCVMPFNSMICSKSIEDYDRLINDIGIDAIKGFADRLEETAMQKFDWNEYVEVEDIDNLIKEWW